MKGDAMFGRIRDWLTKLEILWDILVSALAYWWKDVWQHDLDEYACCSGGSGSWDICGCEGITIREVFGKAPSSDRREAEKALDDVLENGGTSLRELERELKAND